MTIIGKNHPSGTQFGHQVDTDGFVGAARVREDGRRHRLLDSKLDTDIDLGGELVLARHVGRLGMGLLTAVVVAPFLQRIDD